MLALARLYANAFPNPSGMQRSHQSFVMTLPPSVVSLSC
jgi:hypothetical protein